MTKIISVANQKGGCGKSTLTVFFANKLHELGYKVKVIDADYQRTLFDIREIEEEQDPNKKYYPLLYKSCTSIPDSINDLIEGYDFVFIDIPGSITVPSVLNVLALTDLIIIAHESSSTTSMSTMDFTTYLYDVMIPELKKNNIKAPIISHVLKKYQSNVKSHKEFNRKKESYFLKGHWFNNPIRFLSVFNELSTIDTYKHPKYQYEFDMIYNELLTLLK